MSHMAWLTEGGGNQLYKKLFKDILKVDVEAYMIQPMGPDPLGWFKAPINTLDDFRKLKYRAPPGIVSEVFKEIGVGAVSMPGGEIVPSAQRGVIDAAEWISPADDMLLGFHTVWKNYYLQGLHQATDVGDIYINNKVDGGPAQGPGGHRRGCCDGQHREHLYLQRGQERRRPEGAQGKARA